MIGALRHLPFVLFVLSGFCSLLYQVVWTRLAFAQFGVITPVLSVVLSTFMLGLALGSFTAGRWIAPLTAQTGISAIRWYALTELFIGMGALAVPACFAAGAAFLLPSGSMDSAAYLAASAAIIALALLPCCALMGATFPLMMAFLRERDAASPASFSYLYLANVLGAMTGVLATAGALVELLGFRRTLLVAVGVNVGVAVISAVMSPRLKPAAARAPRHQAPAASSTAGWSSRGMLALLFLTGCVSMGLEVVWTRAFTPVMETTIYAFALILAVYLLATWTGSALYRRHLSRGCPLSAESLLVGLSLAAFLPILLSDPRLHPARVSVLGSIFPFCFLLGYLTPMLIDQHAGGHPRKAGLAYGLNVVGCILGPLLASYALLPVLGTKLAMALLAAPFAALLFARGAAAGKVTAGLAALLLAYTLGLASSYEEPFGGFPPGVRVRRDYTATVISLPKEQLLVNGIGMTSLTPITKAMAHFPLATLPEPPTSALVICFGMGTTYRSLLSWNIRATAVELIPSVPRMFGNYFDDAEQVLANPRGRIVIDDGRRFLKRTRETFDLVTIDPPPPVSAAASSLLYSTEFYETVKARLAPSGILHQWFPAEGDTVERAVAQSLRRAFPYVKAYKSMEGWGYHFLASQRPITIPTVEQFLDRMPASARADLAEWEPRHDARAVVRRILARPVPLEQLETDDPRVIITDDQPYNEYNLLRRFWHRVAVWR